MNNYFFEFDTETVNRPGGGYACLLIKTCEENGAAVVRYKEFPESFDDVWKWLKGHKYVTWNVDFDSKAIIHTEFLPGETVEEIGLLGRSKWRGWSFRYTPGKFLEVSKAGTSFTLYDLSPFYGGSLKAAAEKYLPLRRKLEIPEAWYSEMDACLRDERRDEVIAYACADVEVLRDLKTLLLESFSQIGIEPKRLTSPASISMMVFGKRLLKCKPRDKVNWTFQKSFFGGRVEIGTLGAIGRCVMYDIHSAYPSEMAKLVDYDNNLVSHGRGYRPDSGAAYGAYRVLVDIPRNLRWGPFAVRNGAKVIYPVGTFKTWIGKAGVGICKTYGFNYEVLEAHEVFPKTSAAVFPDVEGFYQNRKNPVLKLAVKNVLNSAYGKMAETVDYSYEDELNGANVGSKRITRRGYFGRYTNFPFAAAITEGIRMRIWEVLTTHGERAVYAATDGVILTQPMAYQFPRSDALGAWDIKGEYKAATILGCGRYILEGFSPSENEVHLRGFPLGRETPKTLAKLKTCRRGFYDIPMLDSDSLKTWAMRMGFGDLNVLTRIKKRLRVEDDKRHWPILSKRLGEYFSDTFDSQSIILVDTVSK